VTKWKKDQEVTWKYLDRPKLKGKVVAVNGDRIRIAWDDGTVYTYDRQELEEKLEKQRP
jgi:hypothetical protein